MKLKKICMFCLTAVLALGVAIPAYAKDKLETPTSVTFGEDGAMWDEVVVDEDNKTVKYEVRLYKSKDKVTSKTTKELECTFEDQIAKKGTGTYYVQVRATCSGYTTSEWSAKSTGFYVNSELLSDYKSVNSSSGSPSTSSSSGSTGLGGPGMGTASKTTGWVQDNIGWWYRHADGGYGVDAWEMIDGSWYYFGSNGYMVTGWLSANGAQYYLSASGAMVTGTQNIDGMTYQFDENGARIQ